MGGTELGTSQQAADRPLLEICSACAYMVGNDGKGGAGETPVVFVPDICSS
jgi:hypothetical protein